MNLQERTNSRILKIYTFSSFEHVCMSVEFPVPLKPAAKCSPQTDTRLGLGIQVVSGFCFGVWCFELWFMVEAFEAFPGNAEKK